MAEFELALAVIDTSIKAGKEIKAFIERYRGALKGITIVETSVSIVNCKTEMFNAALKCGSIPRRHHGPITKAIEILNPMLDDLTALLRHYNHPDGELRAIDKVHWATFGEHRAKKIKVEIEDWSRNVFELVVVTLLANNPELQKGTTNGERIYSSDSQVAKFIHEIPGIEAAASMRDAVASVNLYPPFVNRQLDSGLLQREYPMISSSADYDKEISLANLIPNGRALLEHKYLRPDGSDEFQVRDRTLALATILHRSVPEHCYIPTCKGVFRDIEENRYSLLFSDVFRADGVDYTVTRYSLYSGIRLLDNPTSGTFQDEAAIKNVLQDLESRTKIAIQLIHALSYIHAIGWIHKSFLSSKILLAVSQFGAIFPLVMGFHRSRPASLDTTSGLGAFDDWRQIVYNHPDRWRREGNPTFRRRYDVYSLGVVLLELGTGKSAYKMVPRVGAKLDPDEVVDVFIKEARNLKKKQGKAYAENLEACFTQTRFYQKTGIQLDDETDADLCRAILSKWVTELSATQF
jgi:hypothetical protein